MAVVTNGDVYRQYQKLFLTKTCHSFDEIIISGDRRVDVKKPDPRIFNITLDRLRKDPASCVYIGDYPRLDMQGANAIGITSIRLRQGKHAGEEPNGDLEVPTLEFSTLQELSQIMRYIL